MQQTTCNKPHAISNKVQSFHWQSSATLRNTLKTTALNKHRKTKALWYINTNQWIKTIGSKVPVLKSPSIYDSTSIFALFGVLRRRRIVHWARWWWCDNLSQISGVGSSSGYYICSPFDFFQQKIPEIAQNDYQWAPLPNPGDNDNHHTQFVHGDKICIKISDQCWTTCASDGVE